MADTTMGASEPGSGSLYSYYTKIYPKDLEVFRLACPSVQYADTPENQLFFVDDLEHLKRVGHPLLGKKHFVYFMVIHTALLMAIYKYYRGKYEEFKKKNGGMVFEFGLTNTFIYPWEILRRLNVSFDRELFGFCLLWVIHRLMTDYYFCEIIPNDFMGRFIDDPDLNKADTPYGKAWKRVCTDAWIEVATSTCRGVTKNPQ